VNLRGVFSVLIVVWENGVYFASMAGRNVGIALLVRLIVC